ncbi:hypothetical protein [Saccharolobus sp. E5-1-F]|uniref:hypothetical protein n=1 Tax=Saccharolobus sp. E5-1-F TaxID=2663019 RepID=UPI0013A63814|nr:hypothetical protein [Sulfolobus sp. E5-1-F]
MARVDIDKSMGIRSRILGFMTNEVSRIHLISFIQRMKEIFYLIIVVNYLTLND